jgi:hypothetical protein
MDPHPRVVAESPTLVPLVPLKRCAHTTHALLTVGTLGLWGVVWAVAAGRVRDHNRRQLQAIVAHRELVLAANRFHWQMQGSHPDRETSGVESVAVLAA